MRLDNVLGVRRGEVISFIGAGGKTSALFRLAEDLAAQGLRVIGTTTTRVAASEVEVAPRALAVGNNLDFGQIMREFQEHPFVFLYRRIQGGKALGLQPEAIHFLLDRVGSDVLLVEADGSRRLPFKAPYAHEPVLPRETTQVALVAGLNVLGQPLDDEHVYNAEAMIERYGYPAGEPVIWPWVAAVMRDELLGLRGVPEGIPVTALLNRVPPEGITRRRARLIASLLLKSPRIRAVAIGAMQAESPVYEVRRPVAAVVLAAGLSRRMGRPKALLPWGRETVLEAILRRLLAARLEHVVVVTGHNAEQVGQIAAQAGAVAVFNPDYAAGEMLSSLQTGLRALGDRFAACLVVLGDQPQMQTRTVMGVLNAYAEGQGSIIAPSYQMRRGHPVLFDRCHWPALLELPPGSSPRDVINARAGDIAYVNVSNDSILADIDTPEQYEAARRQAGLT